jgi:hypothetical protein
MLAKVGESHCYGKRAARSGLVVSTRDRRLVGYRIPTEWGTLTEEQRAIVLVAGFKWSSRGDFLGPIRGLPIWGGGLLGVWVLIGAQMGRGVAVLILVCYCCRAGCLLSIAGGDVEKRDKKNKGKKREK